MVNLKELLQVDPGTILPKSECCDDIRNNRSLVPLNEI